MNTAREIHGAQGVRRIIGDSQRRLSTARGRFNDAERKRYAEHIARDKSEDNALAVLMASVPLFRSEDEEQSE